jgi:DNA modification methylase
MLEPNHIYTGNCQELSKAIPDESIDLIFTDPPYLKEYLPLYGWLAKEAARVLKPGKFLFAYGAGEYVPDILDLMRVEGLTFFWIINLQHNGGYPRVWYKKLLSGYKPVFVFTKGKPDCLRWQSTVGSVTADKRFHKWGQGDGLAIQKIELFTKPGDIVFEPFCGGGSTVSACIKTNRKYIAFEIDPEAAEIARKRAGNTQPALISFQAEQGVFFT